MYILLKRVESIAFPKKMSHNELTPERLNGEDNVAKFCRA